MSKALSIDAILETIHQNNQADQTALYYFAYPEYKNLILVHKIGHESVAERYWRPYCTDAKTIHQVIQTREPFMLPGEAITGVPEKLWALPVLSGEGVIGLIVHCYREECLRSTGECLDEVNRFSRELFEGWVEFLVAERSRPLSVLFHIAGCISSSLDIDRVLLNVVEQATILFRAKMSSLMLVNKQNRELEMITTYGSSLEYLDKPNLPIHGSILGRVVLENRPLRIENILEEPLYIHRDLAQREGVNALMAAPICFQNEVLGVLNIYSANPRRWQQSEMELLKTFADHAAIAITNARVHDQIISMEEQMQVSAKLATLGELAAGLAHEIRNPLAVINMLVHTWKSAPPSEDDFEHDVNVISQKIGDLNTLVTDLLNLATPRPLERKEYNIEELIDRVLRLLRHRINQQRVQIKQDISLDLPPLLVDRERIEQAILNLLLNALDVTPSGGVIEIAVYNQETHSVIDIRDSGPGIPEDRIDNLFKPFQSTKTNGVGLGLPMTQRIVREHQGDVFVSANGPEGATFTISIPYEHEANSEAGPAPSSKA